MFQSLAGFGQILTADLSALTKITSLVVLPFAHEDLAIILGGYLIVNKLMPTTLVVLSIYGGIVASDFALYGIGAAARYVPWLSRYAVDGRVRRVSDTLKRNVFGLVALCRVVPGIVFVAFIACGWARVSFWRFAAASLIVSAFYLPLMLYLVIVFGDALDDRIGFWAWPLLFAAIGATSFARKRIFAFRDPIEVEIAQDATLPNNSFGMPPLSRADRKVAMAERIPPALFYLPLVLNWIRLGLKHRSMTLPTAANPTIFTGGMWGETKSSYFQDVAPEERKWIADFVLVNRTPDAQDPAADIARAERALADKGLDFPLIAKPDIGWHGHGVRRIDDSGGLANGSMTVRDLINGDARAQWKSSLHLGVDPTHRGVSANDLDRVPQRGEVVRIALIGNQRAGALYRDACRHITPALEARFDAIGRSMTEFHYGRFDLRFDTIEALMRGEDFAIVEINGIGGESIDCWDPHLGVRECYRRLAAQQQLLFQIGHCNRARGFHPTKVGEFVSSLFEQNKLIKLYPASA